MVEQQPSKLMTRVRFPSPAPMISKDLAKTGVPPKICLGTSWERPHPRASAFCRIAGGSAGRQERVTPPLGSAPAAAVIETRRVCCCPLGFRQPLPRILAAQPRTRAGALTSMLILEPSRWAALGAGCARRDVLRAWVYFWPLRPCLLVLSNNLHHSKDALRL